MNKKQLTAELHKMGIKTYRKKSTGESFAKRTDIKKALAGLVSDKPKEKQSYPVPEGTKPVKGGGDKKDKDVMKKEKVKK